MSVVNADGRIKSQMMYTSLHATAAATTIVLLEKTLMKITAKLTAIAVACTCLTGVALAESQFVTTPAVGTQTANANLDFRITIPRFVYFRVGTGAAFGAANNTTINLIDFNIPAASVGTGVFAANGIGAANQGDLGAGTVTARLIANSWGATATVTATAAGALSNGAGDTIDYTKINVATFALAGVTNSLTHPATLANGATTIAATATTGTKVIERGAQWVYSYANDAVVAAGVYGQTSAALAANTNNGRVVYTATMP